MLEALLFVVLVAALVAFVSRPLREREDRSSGGEDPRIAELEARKEARYRQIRDAEMDHAAGKLSEAEFKEQDAELRRDAAEILRELDRLRAPDL